MSSKLIPQNRVPRTFERTISRRSILRGAGVAMALPFLVTMARPIFREVTTQGVRVYSLCGSCGAQLAASATLCDSCAQRRSRSAPNA